MGGGHAAWPFSLAASLLVWCSSASGSSTGSTAPRESVTIAAPIGSVVEVAATDGSSASDTANAGTAAPATNQSSQAPPELVSLLGRTWVITTVDGHPRAFAGFFEMSSGKATGHDGCNFFVQTFQVEGISGGETSLRITEGESTAAPCAPPYESGWSARSGHHRVEGDSLTITADDLTTFEAVDLGSLPMVATAAEIIGRWSVPDGPGVEFATDGTIRLPCATIGTWTFSDALHTEINQAAAAAGCTNGELRSLGWSYDALLSGSPTIRRLPDGSRLFGSSQLGHIVPPATSPLQPGTDGELVRPFVDPTQCAPLSARGDGDTTGSTFDLHLFAWSTTATSFPIQIIGDPNGGPTEPFALLQRYPDQANLHLGEAVTINDWQVFLSVYNNGNGDARWDLPDGGMGYLRSRGLDRDNLVAIISSLTARDQNAAIPGFDYTPGPSVPATLQLLVEHLNTAVYGRSATLQCQVAATNFIYRISTLDGDPVFQYALVIDRPVPLEVDYQEGTLVVIEGIADPTAPTVQDVFNADATTWSDLLANPAG